MSETYIIQKIEEIKKHVGAEWAVILLETKDGSIKYGGDVSVSNLAKVTIMLIENMPLELQKLTINIAIEMYKEAVQNPNTIN